ncbi:MAG: ankyrin repeat domain-containing protein, partial [Verrucomicrobiota bacterium]
VRLLLGFAPWLTVSQTYALGRAAGNGHIDTVAYLLTNVMDNDEVVGLALVDAATYGQTQIVELLLTKKSEFDENNDAALLAAAGAGHTETVMYLLDRVGNINAPDVFGIPGAALRESAANGRTATVKCLVAQGADIHAADDNGPEAALHAAYNNRHPETVAELLSNYTTDELRAILATAEEPMLMEIIRSEYRRRLGNAVSEAIRSQPDIEI